MPVPERCAHPQGSTLQNFLKIANFRRVADVLVSTFGPSRQRLSWVGDFRPLRCWARLGGLAPGLRQS